MGEERIRKAIEIINYAIRNQISVKEASVRYGYADTYVKNIKALIYQKYEENTIGDDIFNEFDTAYKKYTENRGFGIKEETKISEPNKPKDLPPTVTGKNQITFDQKDCESTIDFRTNDKNLLEGDESYPKNHIKTLDELLEYCNVDTKIWQVAEHRVNKWDVTSWAEGRPKTIQNFQVKARLVKNLEVVRERLAGEVFLDMIKGYEAPVFNCNMEPKPIDPKAENNLFEVSIFDLHMGKLAWGGETGENYDTKIARQRFLHAITDLIQTANRFPFSRILFPIGNDFFNSDTIFNTTTQGTQQDEDLRWQKTFNVGVRLIVDGINLLKQTGVPVDVIVIPG